MKYRKKPVIVDAVRVTKELALTYLVAEKHDVLPVGCKMARATWHEGDGTVQEFSVGMDTSNHNRAYARLGDWILLDSAGVPYPCADEVFRETYDAVEIEPRVELHPRERAKDSAVMKLTAALTQMAVYERPEDDAEFLRREDVMELITRWRTQWNAAGHESGPSNERVQKNTSGENDVYGVNLNPRRPAESAVPAIESAGAKATVVTAGETATIQSAPPVVGRFDGPWKMTKDHGGDKDWVCVECGMTVGCGRLPSSWSHLSTCRHGEAAKRANEYREALARVAPYFYGEHAYDHPCCVAIRNALAGEIEPPKMANPDARDAARYRFLRDGKYAEKLLDWLVAEGVHRTSVDFAIDAAMTAEEKRP